MDEIIEDKFIGENSNSLNINNDNDDGLENEVYVEITQEDEVKNKKSNKNKKKSGCGYKKGKDRVVRIVIHNTRRSSNSKLNVNNNESE